MSADTKKAVVPLVAIAGALLFVVALVVESPEGLGPRYLEAGAVLVALVSGALLARPVARMIHGEEYSPSRAFVTGLALALPIAGMSTFSARFTNAQSRRDVHDVVCRVEGQKYTKARQLVAYEVLCRLPDGERARNNLPVEPGDAPSADRIPLTVARGAFGFWYVVERRAAEAQQR